MNTLFTACSYHFMFDPFESDLKEHYSCIFSNLSLYKKIRSLHLSQQTLLLSYLIDAFFPQRDSLISIQLIPSKQDVMRRTVDKKIKVCLIV